MHLSPNNLVHALKYETTLSSHKMGGFVFKCMYHYAREKGRIREQKITVDIAPDSGDHFTTNGTRGSLGFRNQTIGQH